MDYLRIFCAILAFLLIIFILIFPDVATLGAKNAVEMWLNIVIPCLMPYCAASTMLVKSGVLQRLSRPLNRATRKLTGFSGCFSYVFITSLLSGYPNGARLCGELYSSGSISAKEASRMINATSLCGPSFIICAVSSGMLNNISLFKYIIVGHYLSSLIIALINGKTAKFSALELSKTNKEKDNSAWDIIASSVEIAAFAMLKILGFMVVLCVFGSLVANIFSDFLINGSAINALFYGIIEMTNGCKAASTLEIPTALVIISFIVSFGGLSVICQTVSAAKEYNLKTRGLIPSKIVQGIISASITFLYLHFFPPTVSAFSIQQSTYTISIIPVIVAVICSITVLIAKRNRN